MLSTDGFYFFLNFDFISSYYWTAIASTFNSMLNRSDFSSTSTLFLFLIVEEKTFRVFGVRLFEVIDFKK